MRWRMIAHAIDRERVIACGGVNIFGDPKADCWIMGFNPEPFWSEASRMNIARDAAAWAQVRFRFFSSYHPMHTLARFNLTTRYTRYVHRQFNQGS
jgi:hypothetical protein